MTADSTAALIADINAANKSGGTNTIDLEPKSRPGQGRQLLVRPERLAADRKRYHHRRQWCEDRTDR